MSFPGSGVIAIWHDITAAGRQDFYEWHNREHMPERLAIDGFLRGRRYIATDADPQFFTLYNVRDRAVLGGSEYQTRLNNPTAWTMRANGYFSNEARSLCDVLSSAGVGSGGVLRTIRFDCDPAIDQAVEAKLREVLPVVLKAPGIVGAHVCRADLDISRIRTAENEGRVDNMVPRWVVLVEATDPGSIDGALSGRLATASLAALGVPASIHGTYQVQHDLTKTGATSGSKA